LNIFISIASYRDPELQWTIKRWPMFELWIREEVKKAQAAQGSQKDIVTPAESLVNNMIKV